MAKRIRFTNPNYRPSVRRLPQTEIDKITAAVAAMPQTTQFVDGVESNVRTILNLPALQTGDIFEGLRSLGYTVEWID